MLSYFLKKYIDISLLFFHCLKLSYKDAILLPRANNLVSIHFHQKVLKFKDVTFYKIVLSIPDFWWEYIPPFFKNCIDDISVLLEELPYVSFVSLYLPPFHWWLIISIMLHMVIVFPLFPFLILTLFPEVLNSSLFFLRCYIHGRNSFLLLFALIMFSNFEYFEAVFYQ